MESSRRPSSSKDGGCLGEAKTITSAPGLLHERFAGEVELIEGCRRLVELHHRSGDSDDEAMNTNIRIESETDDLPAGDGKCGNKTHWTGKTVSDTNIFRGSEVHL